MTRAHMPEDRDNLRSSRFSRRTLRGPRTAEEYLRAEQPPAYIRRLRAMEREFQAQRRALEHAYTSLRAECAHDPEGFSRRWRALAHRWRFDRLNELIRDHNTWFPAEANLPMDPRLRDFVPIRGRSYRRVELGPEWVLEHFPAAPQEGSERRLPARVPVAARS